MPVTFTWQSQDMTPAAQRERYYDPAVGPRVRSAVIDGRRLFVLAEATQRGRVGIETFGSVELIQFFQQRDEVGAALGRGWLDRVSASL